MTLVIQNPSVIACTHAWSKSCWHFHFFGSEPSNGHYFFQSKVQNKNLSLSNFTPWIKFLRIMKIELCLFYSKICTSKFKGYSTIYILLPFKNIWNIVSSLKKTLVWTLSCFLSRISSFHVWHKMVQIYIETIIHRK